MLSIALDRKTYTNLSGRLRIGYSVVAICVTDNLLIRNYTIFAFLVTKNWEHFHLRIRNTADFCVPRHLKIGNMVLAYLINCVFKILRLFTSLFLIFLSNLIFFVEGIYSSRVLIELGCHLITY